MSGICLELVWSKGFVWGEHSVIGVNAVDPVTIRPTKDGKYVQVINGKPVQTFDPGKLLFCPIGELPVREEG